MPCSFSFRFALVLVTSLFISDTSSFAKELIQLEMMPGHFVPYYRSHDLQTHNEKIRVAVLFIHGTKRDAENYYDRVLHAAQSAGAEEKTTILVPQFAIDEEAIPNQLFWSQAGWKQGDLAQNARKQTKISSFDVVDRLLEQLFESDAFPNLKLVTVIGHSAGGQFVNRYVCAAEIAQKKNVRVQFVIMNPSNYLYLDEKRICNGQYLDEADMRVAAPKYNEYRYGLEELNTKMKEYKAELIIERMVTRPCFYFGGTADLLDAYLDQTPSAIQQGVNRFERFKNYREYVKKYSDERWAQNSHFQEISNVGHNSSDMMAAPTISNLIFHHE